MSCLALFLLASRVSLKGMLLQIWNIHEAGPPWKCLSLFKRDSGKATPQKIPLLLRVLLLFRHLLSSLLLAYSFLHFGRRWFCLFSFSSVCLKDLKCVRISFSCSFCYSAGNRGCENFLFCQKRLLILFSLFPK